MSERQGIEIDYCPQCRGIWLDRGELDKIIEKSLVSENQQSGFGNQQYSKDDHSNHNGYSNNHYDKNKNHKQKSWLNQIFD
jgi:Zn-finger nucleic acid-binding protein